jgi:UDP-N-acetylglucosamine:LPS N-acetylglucosamine transferase
MTYTYSPRAERLNLEVYLLAILTSHRGMSMFHKLFSRKKRGSPTRDKVTAAHQPQVIGSMGDYVSLPLV